MLFVILVLDAAILRNGGNPNLAGDKLDGAAFGVTEDNLAGLGRFGPSALNGLAVLENSGWASTDGGDGFVIAVGVGALLDDHGDHYARCELDWVTTLGFSVRLGDIGWAFVGSVGLTASIESEVFVGGRIIVVNGVESLGSAKLQVDGVDDFDNTIFAVGAGVTFGDDICGFVWRKTWEDFGVRSGVTLSFVELGKVGWRSEEIVPHTAATLFAPHVDIAFVEITLSAATDVG